MENASIECEQIESNRIRQAYARRSTGGQDKYSSLNPGHLLLIQEVEREILSMFSSFDAGPLEHKKILEIGCGTGCWIRKFVQWGAPPENVFGIDLLPERIEQARKLCPQGVHLDSANASSLPFPDSSFDLVLQSTVFTSILDGTMKSRVAREMLRVLKPSGYVLWYDFMFNNPGNADVQGVRGTEIRRLFPYCRIRSRRVTLAAPIGRLVGRYSPLLYMLLSCSKVLCTHYLCFIQKDNQKNPSV